MKSLAKIWPYIRPQWRLLLASVLLSIPLSAIRFSPAPLLKFMLDKVLTQKDTKLLAIFALSIVGIYLVNVVVRFSQAYTARLANERIMRDIRETLFSHYLNLSNSFFTESSVGKLISRVTSDVFYVSQGTINIGNLVREALTLIGLFGYAAYLNWKLLILTILIAPILAWLGKRSGTLMKGYAAKMQEANGLVYSALQEAFTGFKVIKAFAMERQAFNRFKSSNDQYVENALKAARVEEIGGPMVELMGSLAIGTIFFYGGHAVINGQLTSGDLLSFFVSFGLMINPMRTINDINMKLSQAGASADRISETLELRTTIVDPLNPKSIKGFNNEIRLNRVGFRYSETSPWIFRGIDLTVKPGEVVAVVGASGQGKSTLVNLLPRFYDAVEGEVTVDGIDTREMRLSDLRALTSIVTQDVFLFNDTIYANISAGNPSASKDQVMSAAKASHSLDFIKTLPQGFDTMVGDRGQRLSGGERQRISIARAILRNAPILILDEATSSLDSESEKAVQEALETLMSGRTTFVIAHRLSTVRHANKILVLGGGQILETGTHDELLKKGGEYAKFYSLLA